MSFLSDYTNAWSERMKWRFYLFLVVLFFVSAYISYNETRYLLFGHKTQAAVTAANVITTRDRYGEEHSHLEVKYRFDDKNGKQRTEKDDIATDSELAPGMTRGGSVEIQYISGVPDKSRLAGHHQAWLTIPFIIVAILTTVMTVKFWRGYQDHQRRKAAS